MASIPVNIITDGITPCKGCGKKMVITIKVDGCELKSGHSGVAILSPDEAITIEGKCSFCGHNIVDDIIKLKEDNNG